MATVDPTQLQILLLPPYQSQELVNISVDGQLAINIVLEKGFRTPTELINARVLTGHSVSNTVPVQFIKEEQKLLPGFVQNLPEGPKEHYAAASGLR